MCFSSAANLQDEAANIEMTMHLHIEFMTPADWGQGYGECSLSRRPGLRLPRFQSLRIPGQRLIAQNLLISNLGLDNVTHSP